MKVSKNITSREAYDIACWHMNHDDWNWGNRHDQVAFFLFRVARELRAIGA